jgi:hypothetical protein
MAQEPVPEPVRIGVLADAELVKAYITAHCD